MDDEQFIRFAVESGNFVGLRDLFRHKTEYKPTSADKQLIDIAEQEYGENNGKIVKSYVVLSFNKRGQVQERILTFTTRYIIRGKLDFKSKKVTYQKRLPHDSLQFAFFGPLVVGRHAGASRRYAVHLSEQRAADTQAGHTYSPKCAEAASESVATEIAYLLSCVLRARSRPAVSSQPVIVSRPTIIGGIYNRLGIGTRADPTGATAQPHNTGAPQVLDEDSDATVVDFGYEACCFHGPGAL